MPAGGRRKGNDDVVGRGWCRDGGVGMNEVQNADHWAWSGLDTRGAFVNTEYSHCGVDYESKWELCTAGEDMF